MNKMKLIKLSDTHYIIVDDSEIKEGDLMFLIKQHPSGRVRKCHYVVNNGSYDQLMIDAKEDKGWGFCKRNEVLKITHSTEPLSEECKRCTGACEHCVDNIKPLSLSEVEEAINGYSIEKMAADLSFKRRIKFQSEYADGFCSGLEEGFIDGFKAHQELVKDKLFTVEDLELLISLNEDDFDRGKGKYILKEFIDDFKSEKTEWNIEFVDGKIILI